MPDLRRVTLVLGAVPVLLVAALAWHRRWITDDAFINFRVVDNIQHGLGPVYNRGERIEAYTSPAWLAVLWLVSTALWFAAIEWIAVALGILLSVAGFAAAARGSWLLWREVTPATVGAPLGLIVLAALPPLWDFATSGLETGLVFAWLGACFWAVASVRASRRPHAAAVAVLVGLGPLVRPDLAIFSVALFIALLAAVRPVRPLAALRLGGWAVAMPLAYEIFRMGYFAAVVPNTALSKEAGIADWSRGWDYLTDFVKPYVLFVPLLFLLTYVTDGAARKREPGRTTFFIFGCVAAAGVLHAIYVVRVGGDFMHARMLLPSLFGLLMPVAVVPLERRWASAVALLVVPWAIVCAATLRAPYAGTKAFGPPPARIADERAVYAALAGNEHPVTISDHRRNEFARYGIALRRRAAEGPAALVLRAPALRSDDDVWASGVPASTAPARVVATSHPAIGLAGYAAGPDVYIVDQVGLADALAGRTRLGSIVLPGGVTGPARYRAGHDKLLPIEWAAARFGPPHAKRFPGVDVSPRGLEAARSALRCRDIRRLLDAVTEPMTFNRFVSNLGASISLTRLRFSADPAAALEECR